MTIIFKEMGLSRPIQLAVEKLNFVSPTPVQIEIIPRILNGGDWVVSSQTGSGKTAAFLLPLLQQLITNKNVHSNFDNSAAPEVLILCPTRELAQQVSNDAINFIQYCKGIRVATIIGGMPYKKQISKIRGAQLIVSTPGRLLDLHNSNTIILNKVKYLVSDEADRMLDLGFYEDIKTIHKLCLNRQQTLMFSATFSSKIINLANTLMKNPGRIDLENAKDKHQDIKQTLHWVDDISHKNALLKHWMSVSDLNQALIFAKTQSDSEIIANYLKDMGYSAIALHGAMPQTVRNKRLVLIRKGLVKILVATDVAARGLDVPSITHVINFGLPMKAEDYVHRIGRTGRAGRTGLAITFAEHKEKSKVSAIERYTQQPFKASIIPGLEPKKSHYLRENDKHKSHRSKKIKQFKYTRKAKLNNGSRSNSASYRSRI